MVVIWIMWWWKFLGKWGSETVVVAMRVCVAAAAV